MSYCLPLPSLVLFLDFDGVLQAPALDDWREMALCDELQALLDELPQLALVVASTHRDGRNLVGIQRLLPPRIAQRVIGATPVTPRGRALGGRPLVFAHCEQHGLSVPPAKVSRGKGAKK
ncbi:HAD domain-containing protein [Methylibium sp.]|uniref:HAD domain-containing protein n=1 Tax=Methylibium sp. TaxID=2067992 RepID=UPI003D0F433E